MTTIFRQKICVN